MKRIYKSLLFVGLLAASLPFEGNAQSWPNKFLEQANDPNLFELKAAFDAENAGRDLGTVRGIKPYKRWEYFWGQRVDATGHLPAGDILWKEWQKQQEMRSSRSIMDESDWKLLGPRSSIPTNSGVGRVNSIVFHPTNSNIVFALTPAGGLWKTTDGGNTWSCNTDKLPSIGCSALGINPLNPSVMYLGTGDRDAQDAYSVGVLKTTNGGASWTTTALTFTLSGNRTVNKILVHPTKPDTVLAACSNGIYRTNDGGASWTLTRAGNFKDLERMPGSAETLYAAAGGAIFKSTDGGNSWSTLPLPISTSNRIEIAVTPANSNVLYALLCDPSNQGFMALYKSPDAGATWVQQSNSPEIFNWTIDGSPMGGQEGQGWFSMALDVSQTNENHLVAGGVSLWRSLDGGVTWEMSAYHDGTGVFYAHADAHYAAYKPGSGTVIYYGHDGGMSVSSDNAQTWYDKSAGLQIMQIYRLSSSQKDSVNVMSGAQDNSSCLYTASGSSYSMKRVWGGDGMECIIDHSNGAVMYAAAQNGHIGRSVNGGVGFSDISPDSNGDWITPYVIDMNNTSVMYAGYSTIYKSSDRGSNWTPVATGLIGGSKFKFMHTSPANSDVVYACTENKIFYTGDGGANWTNVATTIPGGIANLSNIWVHGGNADSVYITISDYSSTKKVLMSPDGGASWENITKTGLPAVPVNCIVHQRGSAKTDLYVGTDLGVYYTNDEMSSWEPFMNGFPNTVVTDLDIQYKTSKLRAATYGRGHWESKTTNPTTESTVGIKESPQPVFTAISVYPNPVRDEMYIRLEEPSKRLHVVINDLQGRVVNDEWIFNTGKELRISTSGMEAGIYSVTVSGDKAAHTQKITKTE